MEEEQRAKGGRGGARPGAGRKTTGVAGKTVSRYMIDLALGL
ncbi:hypothetical protein [Treponema saccharophilum]